MQRKRAKPAKKTTPGIERITYTAIKLSDGSVYAALYHGNALEKARAANAKKSESSFRKLFNGSQDGFLTSSGRFVGRRKAYQIAAGNGQITRNSFSRATKDLWGEHVEAGDELCALAFDNAREG